MIVDSYQFMTDMVTKFHRFVYVKGWFVHPEDCLVAVEITGPDVVSQITETGIPHGSVRTHDGRECGFRVDCLRSTDDFTDDLTIRFTTESGDIIEARLLDLAAERIAQEPTPSMYAAFQKEVASMDCPTVVDVGGRDRSAFDRTVHFPNCNYVVVDILPGKNVDIVGDAHALSDYLPERCADAIISAFTFEHLLMPWKAVVEMNRILKDGGIVCVLTHQTLGMHDLPWDFWRFSSDAWSGLFNKYTGFHIIDSAMASPQFVVPFWYHPAKALAERGTGFEFSAVLARKIGPPLVDWPVSVQSIVSTMYPDVDDGPSAAAKATARKTKRESVSKKKVRKKETSVG